MTSYKRNELLVYAGIVVLLLIGTYKYGKEKGMEQREITTEVVEDNYQDPPTQEPEVYSEPEDYRYYLVSGSFMNAEFAQQRADELYDMGYEPQIIECEDGLYRVSLFSGGEQYLVENKKEELKSDGLKLWVFTK